MIALARQFGRRLMIMVSGEAMQSAVHFVLNIGLLHALPAREYGVFALVMVMGGLGLTYIRALSAMPASVWIGRSHNMRAANAYDVTFGSGAFVLATLIGLVVALVLVRWGEDGALLGGTFVGLWSLRSHLRTAAFARGKALPAAVGDAVFTVSGMLLSAGLLVLGAGEMQRDAFALLTVANGLGIAATLLALRRPVRISFRRSIRRRYASLWRTLGWSGVGVTTTNLQGQGLALIVAAVAGPAAYAPIAASFVLFVPLRIVAAALVNMIQPVLAAALARGENAKAWQSAISWTLVLAFGSLLYGCVALAVLPFLKLRVFDGTSPLLVGLFAWSIYTVTMLYVMPRVILEAEGALRSVAIVSSLSAVVGMTLVAGIVWVATPEWSMLGALASELMVLFGSWLTLQRRFSRTTPSAGPGWLPTVRRELP